MKTKLLALLLLGGSSLLAQTRVAIGVNIGGYGYYPPPPVPVFAGYADPYFCPGPGYTWVSGYWYGARPRRLWRPGYWAAPRFRGGYYSKRYRGHDRKFDRRYYGGRRARFDRY